MSRRDLTTLEVGYGGKPASYFANARSDIVGLLQTDASSAVLELGCGAGGTGRAVLAASKAGRYVGIELSVTAADHARSALSEVLVGDVHDIDLTAREGEFDALIVSEVLEHLIDPWGSLERLGRCLKPGAQVFASSPNVAHWHVLVALLRGDFNYDEVGVMDRTHLRWFTPKTYRAMFEGAGFQVEAVRPLVPLSAKARFIDKLSAGRLRHLFMPQIMVVARRR